MKVGHLLISIFLLVSTQVVGQAVNQENYVGIQAGFLRTSTQLTFVPYYQARLNNTDPRNSFYAGLFYQHQLKPWLLYRVELDYQQKGQTRRDIDGSIRDNRPFNYVGIAPLIGLSPLARLGLFVGPAINLRVNHIQTDDMYQATFTEIGVCGRLSYRFNWIGLEAGYFKGVNAYSVSYTLPEGHYDYKSHSWQVGLFLVPAKLRKQNN